MAVDDKIEVGDGKKIKTQEFRGVFSNNTPDGIMINTSASLDNIDSAMELSRRANEKREWREVVGAEDIKHTAELVLAVSAKQILPDTLKERGFLDDGRKRMIDNIAGDVSLWMSEERVQNERLQSMTQRAKSVAKELKSRGVTQDNWENAVKSYNEATTAGL